MLSFQGVGETTRSRSPTFQILKWSRPGRKATRLAGSGLQDFGTGFDRPGSSNAWRTRDPRSPGCDRASAGSQASVSSRPRRGSGRLSSWPWRTRPSPARREVFDFFWWSTSALRWSVRSFCDPALSWNRKPSKAPRANTRKGEAQDTLSASCFTTETKHRCCPQLDRAGAARFCGTL